MCASCYQGWWKANNPEQYQARPRRRATCHPDKPVLAQGLCNTCYRQKWRDENRERSRTYGREYQRSRYPKRARQIMLARYGITPEEFDRMLDEQGGHCATCPETGPLQVDHCHDTGRVRGLLCRACNSTLGHARDDVPRLRALIAYLEASASAGEADGASVPGG